MPKAWYCIPSARPVAEVEPVVAAWKRMGYGVALQRDTRRLDGLIRRPDRNEFGADLVIESYYAGYARAVNRLAEIVLHEHAEVDWVVCGGDDTFPDPIQTADTIALQCSHVFGAQQYPDGDAKGNKTSTFGVMQPTGDPWADGQGRIIERIAGSPWLGREWCRRANRGQGPFWPEFRHMYGDEHLQRYAQHLGVFWQRPDLTHYHAHAQRIPGGNITGNAPPAPHMTEWNSQKHWQESKAIFNRLVAGNFEECKPIA